MPCPTCSATMSSLGVLEGRQHFHCPRCGTHRIHCGDAGEDAPVYHDTVPALVTRCRTFETTMNAQWGLSYPERA